MSKYAIAAVDANYAIGYNGDLLFKIPRDMEFFKNITTGYALVMGRKTFDSLGQKPLKNRHHIVITHEPEKYDDFHISKAVVEFRTLEHVKEELNNIEEKFQNIFFIGGESIYKEFLGVCDAVFLTIYEKEFIPVDAYFPREVFEKNFRLEKIIEEYRYKGYPWHITKYVTVNA